MNYNNLLIIKQIKQNYISNERIVITNDINKYIENLQSKNLRK